MVCSDCLTPPDLPLAKGCGSSGSKHTTGAPAVRTDCTDDLTRSVHQKIKHTADAKLSAVLATVCISGYAV